MVRNRICWERAQLRRAISLNKWFSRKLSGVAFEPRAEGAWINVLRLPHMTMWESSSPPHP